MTDERARRLRAEQIIKECPEVWNQTCHISQATFEALVTRFLTALREERQAAVAACMDEVAKSQERCGCYDALRALKERG
jgi:hypothetical protein